MQLSSWKELRKLRHWVMSHLTQHNSPENLNHQSHQCKIFEILLQKYKNYCCLEMNKVRSTTDPNEIQVKTEKKASTVCIIFRVLTIMDASSRHYVYLNKCWCTVTLKNYSIMKVMENMFY